MNLLISSFLVFYLVSCVSSSDVQPICELDQRFKFEGVQVNSVDRRSGNRQFNTLKSYLSLNKFDFEDWFNVPFDVKMTEHDQSLYNHHILTIYTEEFYKRPLQDFYSYRKYIKNIRKSFINSRDLCVNNASLRQYENSLQTIINQVNLGYNLINTLTTLKEGKLSEQVLSEIDLQNYIDRDPQTYTYIFRNKILSYYYTQKLVTSSFSITKGSERYRSLESTGAIRYVLFIPLYDRNFNKDLPCLNLDKLPEFYQSVDS